MLFRTLILKASSWKPVKSLVTRSFLFRPLVRRFIAGETLDEAMSVAEALAVTCLNVSLDLLGENVGSVDEAKASTDAYIETVNRIANSPQRDKINISIKLTALGLDQGDDIAEANYRRLLEAAKPHGIFIRADMEASEYTERTIAMVERVFPDFPNTGTVLQSYLKRTEDDVERLVKLGCRLRIVKGAYLEPPDVAFPHKSDTDESFFRSCTRLMSEEAQKAGVMLHIATHDVALADRLSVWIAEHSVPSSAYEFAMLYGIQRQQQLRLAREGNRLRVLISYGEFWFPWYMRRLAERPANVWFVVKNLGS